MVLFVSGFFFNKEEFKMVDTDNKYNNLLNLQPGSCNLFLPGSFPSSNLLTLLVH